jgi:hypothetical protein
VFHVRKEVVTVSVCGLSFLCGLVRCAFSTEIHTRGCHWFPRMRVTNGIHLGCSLLLPVYTVNSVQTRKVFTSRAGVYWFELFDQYSAGTVIALCSIPSLCWDDARGSITRFQGYARKLLIGSHACCAVIQACVYSNLVPHVEESTR